MRSTICAVVLFLFATTASGYEWIQVHGGVGFRIHRRGYGQERHVVFIHGNPGLLHNFIPAQAELPVDRYRTLSWERPGHGYTPRPSNTDVEQQMEWLHQVLTECDIERPVLVGHSWGGGFSLLFAQRYADKYPVAAVMMIGGECYPDGELKDTLSSIYSVPILGHLAKWTGVGPSIARSRVKREIREAFAPQSITTVGGYAGDEALSMYSRRSQVKAMVCDEDDIQESYPSYWSGFRVPVFAVTGMEDGLVSPHRHSYRLKSEVPDVHLITIEGTGHMIPQCYPELTAALVELVWDSVESGENLKDLTDLRVIGFGWKDTGERREYRLGTPSDPRYDLRMQGVRMQLELGLTPASRELAPISLQGKEGKLYVFPTEGTYGFWSKGYAVPVDVAYLGEDRTILKVETLEAISPSAPDDSVPRTAPPRPCRLVVEMPGGFFKRHNAIVGTRIEIPRQVPLHLAR